MRRREQAETEVRPAWARAASETVAVRTREWCLGRLSGWTPGALPERGRRPGATSLALGFTWAVDALVRERVVAEEDESRLLSFVRLSGIAPKRLNRGLGLSRLAQAAAFREVLRGLPPQWRLGPDDEPIRDSDCSWRIPAVRGFRGGPGSAEGKGGSELAGWMCSERVLEQGLSRGADCEGLASLGLGELAFYRDALLLDGKFGSWRQPLASIDALELWSDGVGIIAQGARSVLVVGESGWLAAELARILAEGLRDDLATA